MYLEVNVPNRNLKTGLKTTGTTIQMSCAHVTDVSVCMCTCMYKHTQESNRMKSTRPHGRTHAKVFME